MKCLRSSKQKAPHTQARTTAHTHLHLINLFAFSQLLFAAGQRDRCYAPNNIREHGAPWTNTETHKSGFKQRVFSQCTTTTPNITHTHTQHHTHTHTHRTHTHTRNMIPMTIDAAT